MLCLAATCQQLGWLTNWNYSTTHQESCLETTLLVCSTLVNQLSAVLIVSCFSSANKISFDLPSILVSLGCHPLLLQLLSLIPPALLPDHPSSRLLQILSSMISASSSHASLAFLEFMNSAGSSTKINQDSTFKAFNQGLGHPQLFHCHPLLCFWLLLLTAVESPLAALML